MNRNSDKQSASKTELDDGIAMFRSEYELHKQAFSSEIASFSNDQMQLLSEEELEFLHEVSSLEGEFELHLFS
ncbi:hypothetical protein ADUPG1_004353, partial [Aduncisulcus paluster]